MKLSTFSVVIPAAEKGRYIIRNTVTDAVVLVDEDLLQIIKKLPAIKRGIGAFKQELEDCTSLGILVPDDTDEIKYFRHLFNSARYNPSIFNPYIVTTTACNLACRYCYEDGISRSEKMDKRTIERTVGWCKEVLERGQYKEFWVTLYGGEPLLDFNGLQVLVSGLQDSISKTGLEINLDMVTNGILLTESRVEYLVRNGLKRVQITLDGSPEVHDQRRCYKSGRGTFDKILSTVERVVGKIPEIRLRCNFDSSNQESLYELVVILAQRGLAGKVFLYFAPINETIPTDSPQCAARFCAQYRLGDKEMAETLVSLCAYAKEKGFQTIDKYEISPCMSTAENGVVIDPEGNLYKCLSFIGRKEFVVGSIWETEPNALYYEFMDDSHILPCYEKKCPYIPLCGGGCRFEAFMVKGDYRTQFCRRGFIQCVNRGLTKLHYSHEL